MQLKMVVLKLCVVGRGHTIFNERSPGPLLHKLPVLRLAAPDVRPVEG